MALTVGLIAGEASGSALGAALIDALKTLAPDIECVGVGGEDMAAAGCEIWEDASALSVMGLAEVLRHLPRLLKLRRALRRRFLAARPDVFVGIDLPDFNLSVARYLRARGLRTMQYVSPSVWAWREGRVKSIARAVDEVLCLLPFETDVYRRHEVPATFVGHPLADQIPEPWPTDAARRQLGVASHARVVALLPGSRESEIRALAGVFAATAARIARTHAGVEFVLPVAHRSLMAPLREALARAADIPVHIVLGRSSEAMAAADVVLLASGTASLEAMLIGRPMVVAYRLAALTRWLLSTFRLLKVDYFSLPNLLAGRELVPELMQDAANADNLAAAVGELLADPAARQRQTDGFARLRRVLANDASATAARAVLKRARGEL